MSVRKELIRTIVERGADLLFDPLRWRGEMLVATHHTVYRFQDGVCIGVEQQGARSSARRNDCVGMNMIGWLVDETASVSSEWRPGASAVLTRPSRAGDAVALTSPTTSVVRDGPRATPAKKRGAPRPPSYHGITDSMTRINVPRR